MTRIEREMAERRMQRAADEAERLWSRWYPGTLGLPSAYRDHIDAAVDAGRLTRLQATALRHRWGIA